MTDTCKYWKYGFCSRKDKCQFQHPDEEFGIDRDPELGDNPTPGEIRSGHQGGRMRKMALSGGHSLTVFGISWDATMREVTQIFRQYEGFAGCQMRGDYEGRGKVAYVQFTELEQAEAAMETLKGYLFDERNHYTKLRIMMTKKRGEKNDDGEEPVEDEEPVDEEEVVDEPVKKKGKGKGKGKRVAPY